MISQIIVPNYNNRKLCYSFFCIQIRPFSKVLSLSLRLSLTSARTSSLIGEPIAWLSELTKQRDYIISSIQNLSLLMVQ